MHLTKLELQEMLREMGVKFSHTESYENLKKLFQEENHIRWMGKGQTHGPRQKDGLKRVIRKRSAPSVGNVVVQSNPPHEKSDVMTESMSVRENKKTLDSWERNRKKQPHAKPEFSESQIPTKSKPSEIFDRGKNVFATVLRRSQNCCELCGRQCSPGDDTREDLKPFHIHSLTSGSEMSVKNIVALCPVCHQRLSAEALPSDLKLLKRKARGKIIRTVQIQRKSRL